MENGRAADDRDQPATMGPESGASESRGAAGQVPAPPGEPPRPTGTPGSAEQGAGIGDESEPLAPSAPLEAGEREAGAQVDVAAVSWWRRKRVLLPAAGLLGLLLGTALGAAGPSEAELATAEEDAAAARDALAEAEAALEEAEADFEASEARSAEEVATLEGEVASLELERDEAEEAAREALAEEAEELLAEAEEEAEAILEGAEARVEALDEREAALDERAADLDVEEERQAANTFGNGIHVVGEDIEAGTYRTDGGGTCYWARLSGLGGGLNDIIANGLPDGPATVQISSSDAAFESSGCGEWTRSD